MLSFEHDKAVLASKKVLEHHPQSSVLIFSIVSAENNPVVLKNSTEHAKPSFIKSGQFTYVAVLSTDFRTVKNQSDCVNLAMHCLQ